MTKITVLTAAALAFVATLPAATAHAGPMGYGVHAGYLFW